MSDYANDLDEVDYAPDEVPPDPGFAGREPAPPAWVEPGPINTVVRAGRDGALGVISALAEAQAEFLPIVKTKTATIKGEGKRGEYEMQYDYADIADVLAEVRPKLAKAGIATIQTTEVGPKATYLVTLLMHPDGSFIRGDIELPQWRGPQDLGSALTYYRRYTLSCLTGVASESDDDGKRAQGRAAAGERRNTYQQRASSERAQRAPQQDGETYDEWRAWLAGVVEHADEAQIDSIDQFLGRTSTDVNDPNLSRARRDAVRREVEKLVPAPFEQPTSSSHPADDGDANETQPTPDEDGPPAPQPDPLMAEVIAEVQGMSQEEVVAELIRRELPRAGNLATKKARLAVAIHTDRVAADVDDDDEPDTGS